MAVKLPLVLGINGVVQQIQPGDQISGTALQDAALSPYTAGLTTNWAGGSPISVGEALDRIAQAVVNLQLGVPIA